jgi:hypothetical protein
MNGGASLVIVCCAARSMSAVNSRLSWFLQGALRCLSLSLFNVG